MFVSELRIIFSLFDKDHDNNISMDEVMQVMEAMGQQPDVDRLLQTFQLVDLDGQWTFTQYSVSGQSPSSQSVNGQSPSSQSVDIHPVSSQWTVTQYSVSQWTVTQ